MQWGQTSPVTSSSASLVTTYVSASSLTAQVPQSNLANSGTFTITITNPAPGGGTSGAINFSVGNPVPAVSSLQPDRATVNGPAFTLNVNGSGFLSSSLVQWNGASLSTAFVNDELLTAQVPASYLAGSTGTFPVTVVNPSPNGGTSAASTFSVVPPATYATALNLNAYDVAWDSERGKLYASVAATQGNQGGIVTIDPLTGATSAAAAVGNGPDPIAISSDNNLLYVGLDGVGQILRLHLPDMTPDAQYKQEISTTTHGDQPIARSIVAAPDNPSEIAAILAVPKLGLPTDEFPGFTVIASDGLGFPDMFTSNAVSVTWGADHSTLAVGGGSEDGLSIVQLASNGQIYGSTTYSSVFSDSGGAHYDKSTGLIYEDRGLVVDPATGNFAGTFELSPIMTDRDGVVHFPLCIPDGTRGVVYFIGQTASQVISSIGVTIIKLDIKTGQQLKTMVVPSAAGTPQKFVRWGNAGLAFITSSNGDGPNGLPSSGPVYLVEGQFVDSATLPDASMGDVVTPSPMVATIRPQSAVAGSSGGVTLTVTGSNFADDSAVLWNGAPLSTSFLSSTEIQAAVPQNLLANPDTVAIRVSNSRSGVGSFNSANFTILPSSLGTTKILPLNLATLNLAWDPKDGELIAPVWDMDGQYPNTLAMIDPASGEVTRSAQVNLDPRAIAVSNDGAYVYTGYQQAGSITRLSLPNLDSPMEWKLPAAGLDGPLYADYIQVAPNAPHTVAVDFGADFLSPPETDGITVFDDGIARPNSFLGTPQPGGGVSNDAQDLWMQWTPDSSTLYALDNTGLEVAKIALDSTGLTGIGAFNDYPNVFKAGFADQAGMQLSPTTGLLYFNSGKVYDPATGKLTGQFGEAGLIAVDDALHRVFLLTADSSGNYSIDWFDQLKFTKLGSVALPRLFGVPCAFVRWGANGLAFVTFNSTALVQEIRLPAGMIYILSDDKLVSAQSTAGGKN
jgi:hypothetical protein